MSRAASRDKIGSCYAVRGAPQASEARQRETEAGCPPAGPGAFASTQEPGRRRDQGRFLFCVQGRRHCVSLPGMGAPSAGCCPCDGDNQGRRRVRGGAAGRLGSSLRRESPARSSRGVVVHTAVSCRRVNPSSAPGRVSGCRVCLHFSLVWGEIKQVSAGGPGTRARTDGPTLPALVPLPRPRAGTSAPPCPARCGRFQNRTLSSEKLELSFF